MAHRRSAPLVFGVVFSALWQVVVCGTPASTQFIVPSPTAILGAGGRQPGLDPAARPTPGANALLGLVVGAVVGIVGAVSPACHGSSTSLATPVVAAALGHADRGAGARALHDVRRDVETARVLVAALVR